MSVSVSAPLADGEPCLMRHEVRETMVEGGERLIEPSSSWFPPQFPSGKLELNSFGQESKRMLR